LKTFKTYALVNAALIGFHASMYFVGVMGFGSGEYASNWEIFKGLAFFSAFGASPNLLMLAIALFKKKDVKENMIFASLFFSIVFATYMIVFWNFMT
jgi:hypothetical protein